MKRRTWLTLGLAVVLAAVGSYTIAEDAGGGAKEKKAKRAGRAEGRRGGRRPAFDYAAIGTEAGLSAEQTEKVTGLVLYYQLMVPLQRAKLEDDQKAKIKTLCKEAAKPVLAAANPRAQAEVLTALTDKVTKDVLNEEQQSKFRSPFGGGRRKKNPGQ